jgi:hypothetical protein
MWTSQNNGTGNGVQVPGGENWLGWSEWVIFSFSFGRNPHTCFYRDQPASRPGCIFESAAEDGKRQVWEIRTAAPESLYSVVVLMFGPHVFKTKDGQIESRPGNCQPTFGAAPQGLRHGTMDSIQIDFAN